MTTKRIDNWNNVDNRLSVLSIVLGLCMSL